MYVSHESAEETAHRLLKVIAQAEFRVYEGSYLFDEFPLSDFPAKISVDALALIRDDVSWSQLIRKTDCAAELFKIFSFHFQEGLDNSGFVGWLASHLKHTVGTGVFVMCGQNTKRGGIFDYWGCPLEVAEPVLQEVSNLIEQGRKM
jgi:hypothetical protein